VHSRRNARWMVAPEVCFRRRHRIALGPLAGSLGAAQGRWLVLVLPLGLLVGLIWGLAFGVGSVGPLGNAGLMVVLGLLLATEIRIGAAPLCAIALGLA
jgi:urease accessory protein